MDQKIFKQGMAIFVKSFPDKVFDTDVMWEFLQDLEDEDFLEAISKIVMSTKEINRATNLIALIREFAIPEDMTAGESWGQVLKQIQSVGSYNRPSFKDQITSDCVDFIGWRNLCMSENISIERAHFLKMHDTISKRERIESLTTSHDVKNLINNIVERIESTKQT